MSCKPIIGFQFDDLNQVGPILRFLTGFARARPARGRVGVSSTRVAMTLAVTIRARERETVEHGQCCCCNRVWAAGVMSY